ncbi:MAG: molybdenum cofactor biosynthesis protein MoaE [Verrucomicrobia bacterium]|nr:molybdenum cofactor biosynthesis protein MoaE [Verrucomicrobiota bacterium]
MSTIETTLTPHVLPPFTGRTPDGCGAVVEFFGIVRSEENGEPIAALEYEAYEPMAGLQMQRIIRELQSEYPCEVVRVIHRIGIVPVGEAAIALQVVARHRGPAFAMLGCFMDRLKQEVPIWKIRALPAPIL